MRVYQPSAEDILNFMLKHRLVAYVVGSAKTIAAANKWKLRVIKYDTKVLSVGGLTSNETFIRHYIKRDIAAVDVVDTMAEKLMSLVHQNTALSFAESKIKNAGSMFQGDTTDLGRSSSVSITTSAWTGKCIPPSVSGSPYAQRISSHQR